MLFSMKS